MTTTGLILVGLCVLAFAVPCIVGYKVTKALIKKHRHNREAV